MKMLNSIVKNIIIGLAVSLNVFVACAQNANSERDESSGKCGDNIFWSYNTSSFTLTINGTGNMTEYNRIADVPWKSYIRSIQAVVFDGNITSIGGYAFYMSTFLSVSIPETVVAI